MIYPWPQFHEIRLKIESIQRYLAQWTETFSVLSTLAHKSQEFKPKMPTDVTLRLGQENCTQGERGSPGRPITRALQRHTTYKVNLIWGRKDICQDQSGPTDFRAREWAQEVEKRSKRNWLGRRLLTWNSFPRPDLMTNFSVGGSGKTHIFWEIFQADPQLKPSLSHGSNDKYASRQVTSLVRLQSPKNWQETLNI